MGFVASVCNGAAWGFQLACLNFRVLPKTWIVIQQN